MTQTTRGRTGIAIAVMLVTPLCFSTNLIFGRGIVDEVPPFMLALIRWLAVSLALLPFLVAEWNRSLPRLLSEAPRIFLLGFLGMWVCGALVYWALQYTGATNGVLIYTTSPIFILLIERLAGRRVLSWREIAGALIGLGGVAVIVTGADWERIVGLSFNAGDLVFLAAAVAWALYSVLLKVPKLGEVGNLALLSVLAGAGAALLLPFAAVELALGASVPSGSAAWSGIAGIVIVASLMAFGGFQFGVRELGASTAGLFMYLLPAYGVMLAWAFLGEPFEHYHAAGIVLVIGGVVLATARMPGRDGPLQPSSPSAGKVSSNQ